MLNLRNGEGFGCMIPGPVPFLGFKIELTVERTQPLTAVQHSIFPEQLTYRISLTQTTNTPSFGCWYNWNASEKELFY